MELNLSEITLKPREVEAKFSIPVGSLSNLRWKNSGPRYFRKPGGRGIFYLAQDVLTWLTSNPVQPTTKKKGEVAL
jgi:hypothetical protein